ncbi:MAG: diaminopimelate epimerase [archaeon]|nr:diaminopimelate epimerase [archaeon]
MKFWKYEGIGNDFIIINNNGSDAKVDNNLCKKMCNRNFGVGADGVLYISSGGKDSQLTMRIINADGSEAEMCGNGIRCAAKFAHDFGLVNGTKFVIKTLKGNLGVEVFLENGITKTVRVDMGAPILECTKIPVDFKGQMIAQELEIDGSRITGTAVSMGNPHFVTFDNLSDDVIEKLGPVLESYYIFPKKTNVEFAKVSNGKLYVRVYERGVAWTLACGTGACAATVAAAINGLVPFNVPIDVHLPGGWLKVTVNENFESVVMEGPASYVYTGEYNTEGNV